MFGGGLASVIMNFEEPWSVLEGLNIVRSSAHVVCGGVGSSFEV